jgi:hypothetical protein
MGRAAERARVDARKADAGLLQAPARLFRLANADVVERYIASTLELFRDVSFGLPVTD